MPTIGQRIGDVPGMNKDVANRLRDIQEPANAAVAELARLTASPAGFEELRHALYRRTIQPFFYNPYEPDGGWSEPDLAPHQDTADIDRLNYAKTRKHPAEVAQLIRASKSWLNISALAALCGIYRIGANKKGFRPPGSEAVLSEVPRLGIDVDGGTSYRPSFGLIAGLLDRLWKPDSAFHDLEVEVRRGHVNSGEDAERQKSFAYADTKTMTIARNEWDLELMKSWAKQNRGFPVLKLKLLPGRTYGPKRFERALELLRSAAFGDRQFGLVHVSNKTEERLRRRAGSVATGNEWADLIDKANDELVKAVKKSRRKAARTYTKEDLYIWLWPVFELRSCQKTDELLLLPDDRVVLPVPGVGRTLEWWHFQVEAVYGPGASPPVPRELDEDPEERFKSARAAGHQPGGPSWGKLMAEIGFSKVVLGSAKVPAAELADREFGFFQAGFGYNTEHAMSNTSSGRVENFTNEVEGALPDYY